MLEVALKGKVSNIHFHSDLRELLSVWFQVLEFLGEQRESRYGFFFWPELIESIVLRNPHLLLRFHILK